VKLLGVISQIVPKTAMNPSMAMTHILGSRSQQGKPVGGRYDRLELAGLRDVDQPGRKVDPMR